MFIVCPIFVGNFVTVISNLVTYVEGGRFCYSALLYWLQTEAIPSETTGTSNPNILVLTYIKHK